MPLPSRRRPTLTTHGSTDCTSSSSGCNAANPYGPIPENGYVWAYTTENSTLTSALWLFQFLDVTELDRALDITDLTTSSDYEVQVRASNAHGDGGWSPSATASAGGPSAVRNLCAHPKNGALLMDWRAPATTNGAITDYDLRYREVGTTTWTEVEGQRNQHDPFGDDNRPDQRQTVRGAGPRAENANGAGPWSASENHAGRRARRVHAAHDYARHLGPYRHLGRPRRHRRLRHHRLRRPVSELGRTARGLQRHSGHPEERQWKLGLGPPALD